MRIIRTRIEDVYLIENAKFEDDRGSFVKVFNKSSFTDGELEYDFKESFYSSSSKGVLRGMHYQKPPDDHAKLVYVCEGEILDVALDIRKTSPTYGRSFATYLDANKTTSVYIGRGIAHGFLTCSERAIVTYLTSAEYAPESDCGIRWDSFNFDWGNERELIISNRDKGFPSLNEH